jgi:predicted aconitase
MQLTAEEQAMLDGARGRPHQKAMDLLVRYGEALGAERFVRTGNVATTTTATHPLIRQVAHEEGLGAVFSKFNLDSDEVVEMPHLQAGTSQLIHGVYSEDAPELRVPPEIRQIHADSEAFFGSHGVQMFSTCTPYQVGNVPAFGEHLAWMESSAVVYANAVLGARTNTEGRESSGAAAVTGRIPYWGLHIPENRFGTHLVEVRVEVEDILDWGLLGYYLGGVVVDRIPVITGVRSRPNLPRLKHFGAAAASSGGVEMYHIPGITPEARTLSEALGGRAPVETIVYDEAERRSAYERLNLNGRDADVDLVMLGCPHDSIEQVWEAATLLEGRSIHPSTHLWVHTPRAIKAVADRSGYTKVIEDAGGRLLSDTCPAISRTLPPDTKVVATDSAKQAHYLPAITGVQQWFGSLAECIDAALTGRWKGELR